MAEELKLQATYIFTANKPLIDAQPLIRELIDLANTEVFRKGLPTGKTVQPTKIEDWKIAGQHLQVTIQSGAYVRAPAAALRFRKLLAEKLGAEHKIGIRQLEMRNLTLKINAVNASKDTSQKILKLQYVENVTVEGNTVAVSLKPMLETDLKKGLPDRVIALIEGIITEDSQKTPPMPISAHPVIVKMGSKVEFTSSEEPSKIAMERGWIKEFPGRGQWIYTTPYAKLVGIIEEILLDRIIRKLEFQPFMLPKLIPLEIMRKMPGYLEEIPEGMYYVCRPPRDPEAFSKFKETVKLTKSVPKHMLKQIVHDPEYVLAPAQCEPFWQFFSHETLTLEDLPIKLYDASGWTYRWEGGGVEGLTRIQEFRRIELSYIGSPEQVIEIRDTVRDEIVKTIDEALRLEWHVVAAAPFYMKDATVEDTTDSRNVAAYDVEVYLPYRGERQRAEWLEIAACFIHKTKFTDSFRIREVKNRPIWTGCCGLGISRWVAAFLAFHGFETEKWPDYVRSRFGSYKLPKTLLWPKIGR